MKIYNLIQLADLNQTSEYSLSSSDEGAGVAVSFNRLRPGETGRKLPASVNSAIICVTKGAIDIKHGKTAFKIRAGEAFLTDKLALVLDNGGTEEAMFIISCAKTCGTLEKEAQPASGPASARAVVPIDEADEFDIQRDDSIESDDDKIAD